MKYLGMPMGMWALFAGSFRRQLTVVFGLDAAAALTPRRPPTSHAKQSPGTRKSSANCRNLKRPTAFA